MGSNADTPHLLQDERIWNFHFFLTNSDGAAFPGEDLDRPLEPVFRRQQGFQNVYLVAPADQFAAEVF